MAGLVEPIHKTAEDRCNLIFDNKDVSPIIVFAGKPHLRKKLLVGSRSPGGRIYVRTLYY